MTNLIRRMTPTEAAATAALIADVVRPLDYYNQRARDEEVAKYTPEQLAGTVSEDPDSVLIATGEGDQPLGFAISYYDDGVIWLAWFGVAESARRTGLGRALLDAVEATCAGRRAHKVWCDTRTSNPKPARVLTAAGYQRLCELKNHWYGQDFYLWEKVVQP